MAASPWLFCPLVLDAWAPLSAHWALGALLLHLEATLRPGRFPGCLGRCLPPGSWGRCCPPGGHATPWALSWDARASVRPLGSLGRCCHIPSSGTRQRFPAADRSRSVVQAGHNTGHFPSGSFFRARGCPRSCTSAPQNFFRVGEVGRRPRARTRLPTHRHTGART